MALLEIKWRPGAAELRRFACLLLPGFLGIVGGVALYRGGTVGVVGTLWGVAALCALLGALSLRFAQGIYSLWMGVAYPIGWCVAHLAMALVYFLVLTPTGLMLRLFGRDRLGVRWDHSVDSYWRAAPRPDGRGSYFKLY